MPCSMWERGQQELRGGWYKLWAEPGSLSLKGLLVGGEGWGQEGWRLGELRLRRDPEDANAHGPGPADSP